MITSVVMPQLGLEVTEGTVVELLVEVGAAVARDAAVLTLATDKAESDVPAPVDGVVRRIDVEVGDTVAVGATLMVLADDGDEPLDEPEESRGERAEQRLRVAPVARRAASVHGVDLTEVTGSGPRGRITLKDVERAAAAAQPSPAAPVNGEPEPLSPMRRAIARRMAASQREIPQYELVREVDASHLLAQKDAAAAAAGGGARPGVNDLLVQAMAEMLVRHPDLAAAYVDGDVPAMRRPESIDVGLAVATDTGLLVPVLRRAHERSLRELAMDRARLVELARSGALGLGEMSGAAITLSNLGGLGIDRFTAMVNPGESAIVAVGRVVDRLVPHGRGTSVVPMLTITVSFDHRIVDGATGARAVSGLADLLEGAMPWRI